MDDRQLYKGNMFTGKWEAQDNRHLYETKTQAKAMIERMMERPSMAGWDCRPLKVKVWPPRPKGAKEWGKFLLKAAAASQTVGSYNGDTYCAIECRPPGSKQEDEPLYLRSDGYIR